MDLMAPLYRSPDERAAQGRLARDQCARDEHASWSPALRAHTPLDLLVEQELTRVPELVAIRHGRMAASPFAYYRGAALPMAADLAALPQTPLHVQLCGDAHLANFGGFASPERELVFDINDFDETAPGPFEWDVKRLGASLEIAGRSQGFDAKECRKIVLNGVGTYREAMREFAAMGKLDIWYAKLGVTEILARWGQGAGGRALKNFQRGVDKAESKDRLKARDKLTKVVDGELRFLSDPPLLVPVEEIYSDPAEAEIVESSVHGALDTYRETLSSDRRRLLNEYRYVDLARKIVGVGSVGTRCWVAMFVGRDENDPLFLQVKEAEASVLERFTEKSELPNHGQRVVEGQRLMQASSDIFLGWHSVVGPDGVTQGLLHASALGLEGLGIHRNHGLRSSWHLRRDLRLDVGTGARPHGRRDCHWGLPRRRQNPSIMRLPTSQVHTPSRTTSTIRHLSMPSRTVTSSPMQASDPVSSQQHIWA